MEKRKIKIFILIFLIPTFFILFYFSIFRENDPKLKVAFLDVGQGDSIFIETPNKKQIIIDGGPNKKILSSLSKEMLFFDRSIDVVVASHPDMDHINGLNDILNRYKVDLFIEPGVDSDSSIYRELKRKVLEKKITSIEARRNMIFDFGDGVYLNILFPDRNPSGLESNTASIVAKLIYKDIEFLMMGDSPLSIENYLVFLDKNSNKRENNLKSDVLKIGHHGSKTSTGQNFIEAVSPKYAVISSGKENKYGHPHKEVLDILNKNKIEIIRTDQKGNVVFKTDGFGLKIK